MKRGPSFFAMVIVSLFLSQLTGCSTAPRMLEYEVDPATATIWPPEPEQPRYRYVGTLIGQPNVHREEDATGWFEGFFRWLVGLDSNKLRDTLILQRPNSGMVDNLGRILVTDISRRSVIVFDPITNIGVVEWRLAEAESSFKTPVGIIQGSDGSYYVADADLQLVIHLDKDGNPLRSFGRDILQRPTGIAWDSARKHIYVADTKAHNIKIFTEAGVLLDVMGTWGTGPGQFNAPTHIFFTQDKLYVTDTFNTRVQILNRSGDVLGKFGRRGLNIGDLVRPKGVTVDSDGNIYVVESFHDYLLVYNAAGQFLIPVGGTGLGEGQFYLPSGVWTDKNDRIYIADMFNGRVVILQYLGDEGSIGKAATH
ncbi:MAG: 6-bladed beta-propeller [Thiohalomonadales bacterium]